MLAQFQARYPTGSLISELLSIYQGKFVVRVSAQVEGVTRATGMAAAETPELAEDRARVRALAVLAIDEVRGSSGVKLRSLSDPQSEKPPEATTIQLPGQLSGQFSGDAMPEQAIQINPLGLLEPITQTNHRANPKSESNEPTYLSVLQASPLRESTPDLGSPEQENDRSFAPTPATQEPSAFDQIASAQQTDSSNPLIPFSNVTPLVPRSYNLQDATPPGEIAETKMLTTSEPIDLSDLIARTNVELKRLGWNNQKGREYLEQKYNKRSRQHLNDEELLEFLHYLESLPSP